MDLLTTKTAQTEEFEINATSVLAESGLNAALPIFSVASAPDSFLSPLPSSDRVVVLDKSVEGWETLSQGTIAGSDVYIIDPTRDGLTQIGEILGLYSSVKSLHIVSHGNAGSFTLAGRAIDGSNLDRNQLSAWRDRLSDDADILLYGCNIAADASGLALIQTLGDLTGADIAASVDLTGATSAGGNWVLEAQYGQIESNLAFTEVAIAAYIGILPNPEIQYANFNDVSQLQLNGNSLQTAETTKALRLTPAATFQKGSAFYKTAFDVTANTSFKSQFQFRMSGGQGSGGADGLTFILQNSAAGAAAIGEVGGGMAYGGLTNSIAVEFDTYNNNNQELNGNHVSVLTNGSTVTPAASSKNAPVDLNGGQIVYAWVDYSASSKKLDVYLSNTATKGALLLSQTLDLAATVGNKFYAGFGAGTGGLFNNQDILNWSFYTAEDGVGGTGGGTGGGGTGTPPTPGNGTGLKGEYFNNITLSGNAATTRTDATVNFNWATGAPTGALAAVDNFSVRWSGQVLAQYNETYTFYTSTDDGVRLWVNEQLIVNSFVDQAQTEKAGSIALEAGKKYNIKMEYYEKGGNAVSTLSWQSTSQAKQIIPQSQLFNNYVAPPPPPPAPNLGNGIGLKAEYFDNIDFTDLKTTRTDATVNFDWGRNAPTGANLTSPDTFSVRWSGQVLARYDEEYTFFTSTDDGVKLWVNDQLVVDSFVDQAVTEKSGKITLKGGQKYSIRMDYFDNGFDAVSTLSWQSASQGKQIIPQSQLFDSTRPEIVLATNALAVREDAGNAIVQLRRNGDTSGTATIEVNLTGVTATVGSDYNVPTSNRVTFAPGEVVKTLSIPILNDDTEEGTETFSLGIQLVSGDVPLGINRTGIVTILDDDAPPSFQFRQAGYQIVEGTAVATITVERVGNTNGTNTVSYATSNGTATAGADYTGSTGVLTFNPGENAKTFNVAILEDTTIEQTETVNLTLSQPSTGAILGTQSTATLNISDNDSYTNVLKEKAVNGSALVSPTAIQFSPDSQYMFISEKEGRLKVAKRNAQGTYDTQAGTVLDISAIVNSNSDRGLLSVAVNPNFGFGPGQQPYVYLLYTYDPPELGKDTSNNRPARLSRYTMQLVNGNVTLVANSEKVLLGKNSLAIHTVDANSTPDDVTAQNYKPSGIATGSWDFNNGVLNGTWVQDYLPGDSQSHTIGTVMFGPDGNLYVSLGDGTSYNFADRRAPRVQDVNSLSGSIMRINPETGQGIADNPFVIGGDLDSNRAKIYQKGLRNPFRFSFTPQSTATNVQTIVGDVGWFSSEEVNVGGKGANFGWPYFEGNDRTIAYSGFGGANSFYNSPTGMNAIKPLYRYREANSGNAVIGGAVFTNGGNYKDTYFVGDASRGTVDAITFNTAGNPNSGFKSIARVASNMFGVVQLVTAPDGSMYYVQIGGGPQGGEIGRWRPV